MLQKIPKKTLLKLMRFWPPYLGSGISIESINSDFTEITVKMVQRRFNTNYVGVHFGGSLYSMCDPFLMFILMEHLGKNYIVWDQAASIDFVKPGRGTVKAKFKISKNEIERIKVSAESQKSVRPEFDVVVTDLNNTVVAKVSKTLYVKKLNLST
jgi:acyl-coenzyme A thioesterase PaaI-like protein